MVDCNGRDITVSQSTDWSNILAKRPGFRRSRHGDMEYQTSVASKRGLKIGHLREMIMWPEEMRALIKRLCQRVDTPQVSCFFLQHFA